MKSVKLKSEYIDHICVCETTCDIRRPICKNLFQWLSSLTSEKKQHFIQGTLMIILSLKTHTLFYLKRYCKALRSIIQDAAISGE